VLRREGGSIGERERETEECVCVLRREGGSIGESEREREREREREGIGERG
jgi:hypothetical protein